ncbi:MAG: hypothetical protein ABJC09_03085 [Terriglobia bacterium]
MPPELTPVDVWTIDLDAEPDNRAPPAILSQDERERAARFRFEQDRRRWSAARSALRTILAADLKTEPLSLQFIYGVHGKPALGEANLHFNVSHSGHWAMIAVTHGAPVGIDLEQIRDNVDIGKLLERIAEPLSGENTPALFQIWARREARTKALGIPLMEIPGGDLRVLNLIAPEGYAAALALVGRDPLVNYRKFHTQ